MFNLVEKELNKRESISETENGAKGYKTSSSALLDLNYQVSSLRVKSEEYIEDLFEKAFYENPKYALKWLFFARDIREGLGERRLFRICYKKLWELSPICFYENLDFIPEFGRWDDLISLVGISDQMDHTIVDEIISPQLEVDVNRMKKNMPISLLAKWLPSENASSKHTKSLAKQIRNLLKLSPRKYRLLLSHLRKHLKIVERMMCEKKWSEIDYEKVPSLANLKYGKAFLNHDSTRRIEYLDSVEKGSSKMNMSVATPVDIVSRYTKDYGYHLKDYDQSLELAWANLKEILVEDILVVSDGSGSMTISVSKSTSCLDIANALAIYTSEHNSGIYKNKYITFSQNPKFVDLNKGNTLREKLCIARENDEIANTNIEAVFDLILNLAIENKIPKDEMIKNVLIISDMEFDEAQNRDNKLTETLFESIEKRFRNAGYKMPKLIFWNLYSRTNLVPLKENELGVILVSGFSQNILKMIMSSKCDPYEVLIETLDDERYKYIYTPVV